MESTQDSLQQPFMLPHSPYKCLQAFYIKRCLPLVTVSKNNGYCWRKKRCCKYLGRVVNANEWNEILEKNYVQFNSEVLATLRHAVAQLV